MFKPEIPSRLEAQDGFCAGQFDRGVCFDGGHGGLMINCFGVGRGIAGAHCLYFQE